MNEIEELTKTLIQTKVIEALKSKDDYIDSLVQAAFRTEVNEHGGKPDNWSKDRMPWLEYCARDAIRKATKSVVDELIVDIRPQIEAAVKKALTADEIVSSFVQQIMTNTASVYYVDIAFRPQGE